MIFFHIQKRLKLNYKLDYHKGKYFSNHCFFHLTEMFYEILILFLLLQGLNCFIQWLKSVFHSLIHISLLFTDSRQQTNLARNKEAFQFTTVLGTNPKYACDDDIDILVNSKTVFYLYSNLFILAFIQIFSLTKDHQL